MLGMNTQTSNQPTHKHAVHFSTGTDTWETPRPLFDELDAEFGFVLDAAALAGSAKCNRYYGPDHADPDRRDGLVLDWAAEAQQLGGAVWLNPPYSRPLMAPFIRKAYEESRRGATVVLLIPARTDTAVWHDYVMRGEVRFLRGRVKFGDAKAGAPFPSAVVIFRPESGLTAA